MSEPKIFEQGGYRYTTVDGELHSVDDAPAMVYPDGTQWWYRGGKVHRDGAAAILWHNGVEEWFQDGKRHRDDGPAVSLPDEDGITHSRRGLKEWWVQGKMIRWEAPIPTTNYRSELALLRKKHFGAPR